MGKVLFISDLHLGYPDRISSRDREIKVCNLLESLQSELDEIFLMGDIFDFWYEYSTVVPKGYTRLLGMLSRLADKGVKISYFTGNHDMWISDYFTEEFGAIVYRDPVVIRMQNQNIYLGHGDGLGPGDHKYKFLKKFFNSSICKFLFKWIHPDIGCKIANFFSKSSRDAQLDYVERYLGDDREWLYIHSSEVLKENNEIDYLIYGHRHLPIYRNIDNAVYINLGDWLSYDTYAILSEGKISLIQYNGDKKDSDFSHL